MLCLARSKFMLIGTILPVENTTGTKLGGQTCKVKVSCALWQQRVRLVKRYIKCH
jgi:hypothetical protein